jgi:hypothetical protein
MKNAAGIIDHSFETFHEIIYGKSERGANERRVFFWCTWMERRWNTDGIGTRMTQIFLERG